MKKLFAALVLCVCALLTLASCQKPDTVTIVYTANGETFHTASYAEGERVSIPDAVPKKEGYVFNGWYYDEGTWEYAFDPTSVNREFVAGTHKLYARFEHVSFSLNEDERSYTVTGALAGLADTQTLVIPATYLGKPVTAIKANAFADIDTFTSVVIPDSVSKIGQYAFARCDGLLSLTLPNSTGLDVDNGAFSHCLSLQSIDLGATLKEIPGSGFEGCTALTSVTVYQAEAVLGSAFKNCTALREITLPDTLKKINLRAFEGCTALEAVHLSKNMQEIGDYAFSGCTSLQEITFKGESGVRALGDYALRDTKITTLTLPSLVRLGEDALCASITSFSFGNRSFSYVGARAFASLTSDATVIFLSEAKEFAGAFNASNWSEGRLVTIVCEDAELAP